MPASVSTFALPLPSETSSPMTSVTQGQPR